VTASSLGRLGASPQSHSLSKDESSTTSWDAVVRECSVKSPAIQVHLHITRTLR
jgi:hypothetical protein